MLVANRMTKEPVTAESVDLLIRASHKNVGGSGTNHAGTANRRLAGGQ